MAALLARQFPAIPAKGFGYGALGRLAISEGDLDLLCLHCQGQAALGAHFQASLDGFADILKGGWLVVAPWLTQPGIAGHSATHVPASAQSMVTVNFMQR